MCVITSTNRITTSPECRAFKSLYKTSAVSLFTHLPMPTLLVAHSITAHTSLSQLCSCAYLFCILSHGFSRKRETTRSLTLRPMHLPSYLWDWRYVVLQLVSLRGKNISSHAHKKRSSVGTS